MGNEYTRDDGAYFAGRALKEREMASRSGDAVVALVHKNFAEAYENKLSDHRPQLTMAG